MHRWVKDHAGVSWGQPEGNCLEMSKAIKCSQCYRALCSCRCASINKFAMSVCLSRYAFIRASTYGAESWHGGRVWRAGRNRQLFVATRQVKGHLEVKSSRNALWLPNLVSRTPDQSVVHCWGQRSSGVSQGSNCLEMPYGHQISGEESLTKA